jgi:hypothetical protein
MSLFFSNEEIQNTPPDLLQMRPMLVRSATPDGKSQLSPIWETPPGEGEFILKRGEYILPGHYQAIQWDFLPDQIRHYREQDVEISGVKRVQTEIKSADLFHTILLYAGSTLWLKFTNEDQFRAWAIAYAVGLPAQIGVEEFVVHLPKDDREMLPLEEPARCKGIRTIGERAYRCHREAFHGGWCRFIAHHKEI